MKFQLQQFCKRKILKESSHLKLILSELSLPRLSNIIAQLSFFFRLKGTRKTDTKKEKKRKQFHFLYLICVHLIRTFIGRKRSIQKYVFEGKAEKVYFVTTSILNHWWIFSSIWQENFSKIIHPVFMYSCKLFVDSFIRRKKNNKTHTVNMYVLFVHVFVYICLFFFCI